MLCINTLAGYQFRTYERKPELCPRTESPTTQIFSISEFLRPLRFAFEQVQNLKITGTMYGDRVMRIGWGNIVST